jgi:lactate permease
MLSTKINPIEVPGMMTTMAKTLAGFFGPLYPAAAPFIGILGAFMSGSNTVSNMLFASMQAESAVLLNLPPVIITALQCSGGAIGSMNSINNVVAACATVGIHGLEGKIVRRNAVPMLVYTVLVIIIAYILINLNMWTI